MMGAGCWVVGAGCWVVGKGYKLMEMGGGFLPDGHDRNEIVRKWAIS